MLVLLNMIIEPSNVRKKKINKGTTICDKKLSNVILELHNVIMGIVKCEKKDKGTTQCEKKTVKCDVEIA